MISMMNEREINQNLAAGDLSFFGMEDPQDGAKVRAEAVADRSGGNGSVDSRVLMEVDDLGQVGGERDAMVSEHVEMDQFGSSDEASGNMDVEMRGARVSGSKYGEDVSAVVGSGVQFLAADWEGRGFDKDVAFDAVSFPRMVASNWMNGFEHGDMVWGKVKSHPWWPGHIFNEAFASSSVRRKSIEGHVLVAFFGDSSYGWFDPAELIPFDPHYAEKSMQTTLRTFVKAVEEAVDETSRREALGLTCHCRTPSNFCPARVPGYFFVNVHGFEPWGIYSSKQIKSARDRFVPKKAISFLHQVALDPLTGDFAGIDRIKGLAAFLAYRRAVFEEFDETYAQAFGVEPVRPSSNNSVLPDQPEKFAPRATPLSGPLVIAETLRHKKTSSTKSATTTAKAAKISSSKKNKYVLKRRDEPRGDESASTSGTRKPLLPDFPSPTQPFREYHELLPSQQQSVCYAPQTQPSFLSNDTSVSAPTGSAGSQVDDFFLQKRQLPPQPATAGEEEGKAVVHGLGVGVGLSFSRNIVRQDADVIGDDVKDRVGLESEGWSAQTVQLADGTAKKEKIKKRKLPREEGSSVGLDGAEYVKKKKKKKKNQSAEASRLDDGKVKVKKTGDVHRKSTGKSVDIGVESQRREYGVARAGESDSSPIRPPLLDPGDLNFRHAVSDLQELALDPFYGIERNAPTIALHVFLKFRSLVYQKSLVLQPASDQDVQEVRASKELVIKTPRQPSTGNAEVATAMGPRNQGEPLLSKTSKTSMIPDDPTKAGRKRSPSDRQEELNAKRLKKLDNVKALAAEKKAALSQKATDGQLPQRERKEASATKTTSGAVLPAKTTNKTVLPVKKQEPPAPPAPTPSPTFLVMKFPQRSSLPSIAQLKATFAKYGPLDLSGSRVYWKSYTCKVLFKFKTNALAALKDVRNKSDLFGQVRVYYYLREVEAPVPESPTETRPEPRSVEGLQLRPGYGAGSNKGASTQPRPLLNPNARLPIGLPKSILKKPSDDVGASGAVREAPRVKFLLDGGDSKVELRPPMFASANDGRGNADGVSSAYNPPLDPVVTKISKSVSFPPPPSLSRPPPLHFTGSLDNHHLPPPPSLPLPSASLPSPLQLPTRVAAGVQLPLTPPPPPRIVSGLEARGSVPGQVNDPRMQHQRQYTEAEDKGKVSVDISDQMLRLLVSCSDIVAKVTSSLGYLPYHPL